MILQKGSRGAEVRSVQELLNALHFQGRKSTGSSSDFHPLDTDGIFGDDTEDAVTRFQEDHGLYTDGRVGPVTLEALQAAFGSRNLELNSQLAISRERQRSVEFQIPCRPRSAHEIWNSTLRWRSREIAS